MFVACICTEIDRFKRDKQQAVIRHNADTQIMALVAVSFSSVANARLFNNVVDIMWSYWPPYIDLDSPSTLYLFLVVHCC